MKTTNNKACTLNIIKKTIAKPLWRQKVSGFNSIRKLTTLFHHRFLINDLRFTWEIFSYIVQIDFNMVQFWFRFKLIQDKDVFSVQDSLICKIKALGSIKSTGYYQFPVQVWFDTLLLVTISSLKVKFWLFWLRHKRYFL